MNLLVKTLTTICTITISTISIAQHRDRGNGINRTPQNHTHPQHTQNYILAFNHHPHPQNNSHYSIHTNYYAAHDLLYLKKTTRISIRQSAFVIKKALNYLNCNRVYCPWLAKAVKHQRYAKQLYALGNYISALHHSERAEFLAWHVLNDAQYSSVNHNEYPNPYQKPNHSHRRTNLDENSKNQESHIEDLGDEGTTIQNSNKNEELNGNKLVEKNIDEELPENQLSDSELLKMDAKDLDVD